MNLDFYNSEGNPENELLTGIPFIRVEFQWKRYLGETLEHAIDFYSNALAKYNKKIILVFTHRSGFEGFFKKNWEDLTDDEWTNFCMFTFADQLAPAFEEFAKDPRITFQIWNEPEGAYTGRSVLLQPIHYGLLFKNAYDEIKHYNINSQVITAGFKSGAGDSWDYFLKTGISKYDGFALHLYVCGARSNPNFKLPGNNVEDHLDFISQKVSRIYLTEFGVLDNPTAKEPDVAKFAFDWRTAALKYPKVKAILWYAWGMNMDNGYGVGNNTEVKRELVRNALAYTAPSVVPDAWIFKTLSHDRNLRSLPRISTNTKDDPDNVLILVPGGKEIEVLETSFAIDPNNLNYYWKECKYGGKRGWIAFQVNMTERVVRL